MPRLPVVSGSDVVKALTKAGFFIDHQTGSHVIVRQEGDAHGEAFLVDVRCC